MADDSSTSGNGGLDWDDELRKLNDGHVGTCPNGATTFGAPSLARAVPIPPYKAASAGALGVMVMICATAGLATVHVLAGFAGYLIALTGSLILGARYRDLWVHLARRVQELTIGNPDTGPVITRLRDRWNQPQ